jgi:hypothetical protein
MQLVYADSLVIGEADIQITYDDGDNVVGISSIVGMVLGIIIFIIIAAGIYLVTSLYTYTICFYVRYSYKPVFV